MTDSVICSNSREGKAPSYSHMNMVGEFILLQVNRFKQATLPISFLSSFLFIVSKLVSKDFIPQGLQPSAPLQE